MIVDDQKMALFDAWHRRCAIHAQGLSLLYFAGTTADEDYLEYGEASVYIQKAYIRKAYDLIDDSELFWISSVNDIIGKDFVMDWDELGTVCTVNGIRFYA